jgi:hypothetical protein
MKRFAPLALFIVLALMVGQGAVMLLGLNTFIDNATSDRFICYDLPQLPRAKIEKRAWLKFPPSAQNVSVYGEGFSDCIIYTRFEIAPGDLNALLQTTLIKQPLSSKYPWPPMFYYEPQEAPPGWNLGMRSFLAGEGSKAQYYQGILINMDDPNLYVVYVITYDNRGGD